MTSESGYRLKKDALQDDPNVLAKRRKTTEMKKDDEKVKCIALQLNDDTSS